MRIRFCQQRGKQTVTAAAEVSRAELSLELLAGGVGGVGRGAQHCGPEPVGERQPYGRKTMLWYGRDGGGGGS